MGTVRLAFELYIGSEQKCRIVSDKIFDKKLKSDLVIHHISAVSSVVSGGAAIMLFCSKVKNGDVDIEFYEQTNGGDITWSSLVGRRNVYVHYQTGIRFKTPKYHNLAIERPVQTYMKLLRPSDGATSDPLPFQFYPTPSS